MKIRGRKKIVNLEVVTTRGWKKKVKVVNFVVVEGLQGCPFTWNPKCYTWKQTLTNKWPMLSITIETSI
jgi:hypothetical protein